MQCTSTCDDCVVTFLLREEPVVVGDLEPLVLDEDQVRVVRLLGRAGLVPELKFELAS
jgi:hypothetical protein